MAVDASRDRLALAHLAGVLELALDASDTVVPKNSLEKMLVHQMAVLHRQTMKLSALMDDLSSRLPHEGLQHRTEEVCRLGASIARLAAAYQSGLLALQRVRASRSLRSSTCTSPTAVRRSLRRSLVVRGPGGDPRNVGGARK